jgi:hypothetical protein
MGVSLQQDSRNVLAEDFDGDGRPDLAVTTFEAWPEVVQTLKVYLNRLESTGSWAELRFREGPGAVPVWGAAAEVRWPGGVCRQPLAIGQPYRSQTSPALHFGLGHVAALESVEIRWGDGTSQNLGGLEVNRRHDVTPPPARR